MGMAEILSTRFRKIASILHQRIIIQKFSIRSFHSPRNSISGRILYLRQEQGPDFVPRLSTSNLFRLYFETTSGPEISLQCFV